MSDGAFNQSTEEIGLGLAGGDAQEAKSNLSLLAWDGDSRGKKPAYTPMGQAKFDPAGEVHKPKPVTLQGGVKHDQQIVQSEVQKPEPVAEPVADIQTESERNIDWDPWRKNVLTKVVNNFKRRQDETDSHFEDGQHTYFSFDVKNVQQSDGQVAAKVTKIRIDKSSGDEDFDRILVNSIRDLNRSGLPHFPKGTHRTGVRISDNIQPGSSTRVDPDTTGDIESVYDR